MRTTTLFHPTRRWCMPVAFTLLFASFATSQGWVKGRYLTAAGIDCPPFVFVSLPLPANSFGTDVNDQFTLGAPGRQLMFMTRQRAQPAVLFPRQVHKNQGLINSPNLSDGAVHEPAVYHDPRANQYWVIFSYANDLANRHLSRPCDLYAINVTAAVANPTAFDPDALPVSRLTDSPTTSAVIFARAFNPTWAAQSFWPYGINNGCGSAIEQRQGFMADQVVASVSEAAGAPGTTPGPLTGA